MAFISQLKFAELAGTTVKTIKDGIKSGKLVADPKSKGLDPQNPKNKSWLDEWERKKNKRNEKSNPISEVVAEIKRHNDLSEKLSNYGSLEDQKLEQEIKLKKEQTLAIQQKRLASMGTLVLKETVERRISKLGQSLKTHVLAVPRRVSPRILSLVKSGATVAEIEKEIAEELEKALQVGKRP
jgi:hypothetical protein